MQKKLDLKKFQISRLENYRKIVGGSFTCSGPSAAGYCGDPGTGGGTQDGSRCKCK